MKLLLLLSTSFVILSSGLKANNKDYATQRQKQTANITNETSPSIVPGFTTSLPNEVTLDSPSALKSATDQVLHTNQNAATLKNSAETRPYYVLDIIKDPIVTNSTASVSDPEKVISSQLFSRPLGSSYTYKICTEVKPPVEFKCSKTLIPPTMHIEPAKYSNYWCTSGHHGPDDPRCKAKKYYPVPIKYVDEQVQISPEQWSSDCGTMDTETKNRVCKLIKQVCPKGPETREITATEGPQRIPVQKSITRNCWKYEYTYECSYGFSKTCEPLRNSFCEQIESKCIREMEGVCIEWEQTYRCPTGQTQSQELVSSGGFDLPTADAPLSATPNTDMTDAISKLSILKNIQDEVRVAGQNINGLQIFKGDDRKCTIAFAGFKNCCVKKGWGLSSGLSHCETEEKDLAKRQKEKLCVKIGIYCAEKILGQCIRKKTSYCCFPTKLSRILQEQGRKQLNIGWGKKKHPECRGFTVDELSRLDFEKLDLSELFEEITSKAKKVTQSTVDTVSRNLSNRVTQMGNDFKPHHLKHEANKPNSGEF